MKQRNQNDVFHFLNPNGCDTLSKMKGIDLQELIYLSNHYFLELRKDINLPGEITFGCELEMENAQQSSIYRKMDDLELIASGWKMKDDGSLDFGVEINSPVLKDKEQSWKELNAVCHILKDYSRVGKNSGGHIHFGSQALGKKVIHWENFFQLWAGYEHVVYRFVYGDQLDARESLQRYASPLAPSIFRNQEELFETKKEGVLSFLTPLSHSRYQAINLGNVCKEYGRDSTIEFRAPNSTQEAVIWQNNVNLLGKMLVYATEDDKFDKEKVQFQMQTMEEKKLGLEDYQEIYLQDALELSDQVFSNNLDKVYFLRQYLKSFETVTDMKKTPKKVFVKK